MQVERGRVVCSKAGHDAGGWFAVLAEENGRVLLCDGKRRPLAAPKRKSVKHIRKTNTVLDLSGIDTNRKLRRALAALRRELDEGGNQLV